MNMKPLQKVENRYMKNKRRIVSLIIIVVILLSALASCGPDSPAKEEGKLKVTVSVSCKTILDNMDILDKEKTEIIPEDGWVLEPVEVGFNEGQSAFDVLLDVCKSNKIHLEYMSTTVYSSSFIEGLANLYEFDCGPLSGWMYKVNDWFPNYGCSQYELKDGDVLCFEYSCDLGEDIGGGYSSGSQTDK